MSDGPSGRKMTDEEMLLEYLFSSYKPSARPVLDSSDTVDVQIQLSLMHIKELVGDTLEFCLVPGILKKEISLKQLLLLRVDPGL